MVSSKPDGSSFKHNCTFLSRYRKLIQPDSVAAFLTWGHSLPGAGGSRSTGLGMDRYPNAAPGLRTLISLNGPVFPPLLYAGVEDFFHCVPLL